MGMAASQARLLTITARLNHIELESQNLSNAKIRLSDNTQKASDKYIKALNKTEYLYNTYSAKGEMITQNLTGAALTNYGELKNQYGLINSAGQILVSELDGKNFQDSNTLEEFLEKYGVLSEPGKGEMVEVINPDWKVAWDEYNKELGEWKPKEPDKNDEKYWSENSSTDNELYRKFRAASESCYNNALGGASGCYCHVLAHMLLVDFEAAGSKNYQTITGDTISVDMGYISGSAINGAGKTPDMRLVSQEIFDRTVMAAENEDMKKTLLEVMNDPQATELEKKVEQLMNNYYLDDTGNPQLKQLAQKCVDLFYVLTNYTSLGLDYKNDCIPMLITFQKDMEQAFKVKTFNEELYNNDRKDWLAKEPEKPDVPMYIAKEVRKVTDSDEAQWYINLWHRMNGTSDFKGGFGDSAEYDPSEGWASKSKTEQSWAILKDGDMNSPEYLKYAIENGLITIEQVQFVNPSDADSGLENVAWTSVIFDTIVDVTEQKDQIAITKAETEYEQALSDIEAKDKQLDVRMKKLDTEHNALQTEYDSIKGVIEKNVERNFKIFS